ncbi:Asp23/Gls24 family envelope stress response protein [Anaerobacillus sp. MEB173]|uniref:Asp23/Gls24 family envelope stress response protein n=1 Tax=Anaerobacillus sp. MEB173 TaxID=3383345 RepID=UPI003F8F08F2
MVRLPFEKGDLYITDEVIAIIAKSAIKEIDGLNRTTSRVKDQLFNIVSRTGGTRGISIMNNTHGVTIQLKVSIGYGMNIQTLCYNLQKAVKEQVELLTGIKVNAVNVCVETISIMEKNKKNLINK